MRFFAKRVCSACRQAFDYPETDEGWSIVDGVWRCPACNQSATFQLLIRPEDIGGWRVSVLDATRRNVATTIENTPYEAAVIGVGLWHRWKAAHDVR